MKIGLTNLSTMFLISGVAFVLLVGIIMFLLGIAFRKRKAEKQIGGAKTEADRILAEGEKRAEARKREIMIEAKEEIHKTKVNLERDIKERRAEVSRVERRVLQKEENLEKKNDHFEQKEESLKRKVSEVEEKEKKVDVVLEQQMTKLETVANLSKEEAKKYLLSLLEDKLKMEKVAILRNHETQVKEESEQLSQDIIATAIQSCAPEYVAESTVSVVALPSDDMKGRIIGREGRNIRTLETLTGIDLIIDDTPEAVVLSGFDPIRREIARIALEKLIIDGRIHPARIEEMVNKAKKDIENTIKKEGDRVTFEMGIHGLHPELIRLIGRLKYRTSYGQNILKHSIEVAHLAGVMASELGLDPKLAKRAGMLHDIGKSIDFEMEGSHVYIGADIIKKYKEHDVILNAVLSHHGDEEPDNVYSVLIQAADAISAARPGARRETLETYVKRIEKLEKIASSFDGVEKSYAVQAGREIRVMVIPTEVSDENIALKCREIVEKIEDEMEYPGQIKVNVIREMRAVDYAK